MTYEEKKEYLRGYREAMHNIASLTAERQKWRDLSEKITQNITPVPGGSGSSDKIGEAAAEIADIEQRIVDEIRTAEEQKRNVKAVINSVKNNRHKIVLKMIYISGMSFFKVSCVLGKSERNIQDIHKKAVEGLKI